MHALKLPVEMEGETPSERVREALAEIAGSQTGRAKALTTSPFTVTTPCLKKPRRKQRRGGYRSPTGCRNCFQRVLRLRIIKLIRVPFTCSLLKSSLLRGGFFCRVLGLRLKREEEKCLKKTKNRRKAGA